MRPYRDAGAKARTSHRAWWTGRADRLEHLIRWVLRTVLIGACVLSVVALGLGAPVASRLSILTALSYGVLLLLLGRGAPQLIGIVATAVLLFASTYAMLIGRGIHDVAVILLPVVLVVGSLLLSRAHFIALVVIGAATTVGVGMAERLSLLPEASPELYNPEDVALVPVILMTAGAVIILMVDHLHRSLSEAEASERRYREIFNATHDAILVHDQETGKILDVNEPMLELYGLTRQQALDCSVADLTDEAVAGPNQQALERIGRADTEGPQIFEWRARRSDGSLFWAEVTLRASDIEGRHRVLAVVRDVDARKRRHERVAQSEKMEAVGQLAGGIAHDFNNQLTGIIGFADLLKQQLGDRLDLLAHVGGILTSAEHAADLTAKLLAFARKGRSVTEVVNLHDLVRQVVTLLTRSIDRRIQVVMEFCPQEAATLGDPSQLANALLNLGLNARDAMPDGGTLVFRTKIARPCDFVDPPRESGEVASDRYVELQVVDTGTGMDAATRARVFEPFFTTKASGTGMGLAAVYGTVQDHRGTIHVESSPGRGTAITLLLPYEKPDQLPDDRSGASDARNQEPLRVLLIEDEPMVAESCKLLVEGLGHSVVWCCDGQEGVETYQTQHASIDLILMDLTTPRLSAVEAFDALRDINPNAVIVLYSGFGAGAETRKLIERGAHSFLQKPFRLKDLSDLLSRVARDRGHSPEGVVPASSQ